MSWMAVFYNILQLIMIINKKNKIVRINYFLRVIIAFKLFIFQKKVEKEITIEKLL